MASSVFFKFKSQREPTRVEFDGTGISVFELKREIINKNGLGDGSEFDLFIYTDDNSEEYDDDTTIIPRSTTVIARRQPAAKPGAGRAARYVSGKMPISAKNAGRKEQAAKASVSKPSSNAISQMNNAMTEEEKMAAMFAAQTEQWSAQQEEMSHQTPVFKPGQKARPTNVPDHEPPNGYICYRCGQKGHWIQLCPTNDDPEFDNRPRVKRTTGIPRSFLQKVDKDAILAQSEGDETKRPSGVMVNADGDFVIAGPDKAAWEKFQAKANTSAAKQDTAQDKEVAERGLECSIDKKMFVEPVKTPCCQKTFCNECINNALIDGDLVCPACETENVLMDDLTPDEETAKKIEEYLKEKEAAKAEAEKPKEDVQEETREADAAEDKKSEDPKPADGKLDESKEPENKEKSKSPVTQPAKSASPPTGPRAQLASQEGATQKTEDASNAKKRPADDLLENPKIPKGPRAMQNQQNNQMPNMNGMPNMGFMGMPPMGMQNMMGMPNMNMGGMPFMGMPMGGMPNFNGNFNGGWDMNNMNMGNMGNMNGMNGFNGMNGGNMQGGFQGGRPFNGQQGDEDAYFRKPVNPHRHQNKGRRARPSDYREL